MVLVVLEAWVNGAFDRFVFFEEVGNVVCVFGRFNHSEFECFDASKCEIAVEGTWVCTETVSSKVNLVVESLIFENNRSHDKVRVASDVFGQTVE
jgi:hypothetical protein